MNWIAVIGHKRTGVLYMLSALLFFLVGGMEAMVLRAQLALPNLKARDAADLQPGLHHARHHHDFPRRDAGPDRFRRLSDAAMIGAADMAFPRLNAFSFWLQLCGGLLLYASFIAGGAPDAGWFSYAPLSEKPYSPGPGLDYWALAICFWARLSSLRPSISSSPSRRCAPRA